MPEGLMELVREFGRVKLVFGSFPWKGRKGRKGRGAIGGGEEGTEHEMSSFRSHLRGFIHAIQFPSLGSTLYHR